MATQKEVKERFNRMKNDNVKNIELSYYKKTIFAKIELESLQYNKYGLIQLQEAIGYLVDNGFEQGPEVNYSYGYYDSIEDFTLNFMKTFD